MYQELQAVTAPNSSLPLQWTDSNVRKPNGSTEVLLTGRDF